MLDTSIDLLMGMDTIRAAQAYNAIHSAATDFEKAGMYSSAEKVYRDALLLYPSRPDMLLGLGGVLALSGEAEEAIGYLEKGLPLSEDEKQKATCRAVLCFLYLRSGRTEKANALAASLPHTRESREVIQPLIRQNISQEEIDRNIQYLMFGELPE